MGDDRYSNKCFTPGADQCGQYRKEGDCYNREHSWPKSWWGRNNAQKTGKEQHSDLHHLFPTDGFVNNVRGNHPLGQVGHPEFTSTNGCKLGRCQCPSDLKCYTGTCFEPVDKFKGAFARAYFYMALRYADEGECCTNDFVDRSAIRPWMEETLRTWHKRFPPSEAEVMRNARVEAWQGNRNPFVDRPDLVGKIEF